jgi:TonB family protein
MRSSPHALFRLVVCAVALSPSAAAARVQNPGDPVPPSHAARAILEEPVFTSPEMVAGVWTAEGLGPEARTLSGAPRVYEITISEREVVVSSPDDPYGTRVFGVVAAKAVESWVEYELRGQGGTYFLTAQFGKRAGGATDGLFVLTPQMPASRIERFAVSEPEAGSRHTAASREPTGSDVAVSPVAARTSAAPAATPQPPEPSAGARPRRAVDAEDERPGEPARRAVGPVHVNAEGLLSRAVHRVSPTYPSLARSTGVDGVVVVHLEIRSDGTVSDARALSGPTLLRSEAVRAAKRWKFTPFVEDGKPVSAAGELAFRFSR